MNSISNGPTTTRFARADRPEPIGDVDAVFVEFRLEQRERERRGEDRAVDERQHVRHAADVILVAVRQHERGDAPFLLEIAKVRHDEVDAEQFRIGEHHTRIHNDRRLAPREREHVHAELAEAAEWNDFQHSLNERTEQHRTRSWRNEKRRRNRANAARTGCWARLR